MSSVGIQLVKRQIRDDESCEPSAMEALFFPLVFFSERPAVSIYTTPVTFRYCINLYNGAKESGVLRTVNYGFF